MESPYGYFLHTDVPVGSRGQDAEAKARAVTQERRRDYFATKAEHFAAAINAPNLTIVHREFLPFVSDNGILTKIDFLRALYSLSAVVDSRADLDASVSVHEQLFSRLSGKDENAGAVAYSSFIQLLYNVVNGDSSAATSAACFALFDGTASGYVLRKDLAQLREARNTPAGRNPLMLTCMLKLIKQAKVEDCARFPREQARRNKHYSTGRSKAALATVAQHSTNNDKRDEKGNLVSVAKGTGRERKTVSKGVEQKAAAKDAKAAAVEKSAALVQFALRDTLSAADFHKAMSTDPIMVHAFLTCILRCCLLQPSEEEP